MTLLGDAALICCEQSGRDCVGVCTDAVKRAGFKNAVEAFLKQSQFLWLRKSRLKIMRSDHRDDGEDQEGDVSKVQIRLALSIEYL